jgi:hypothetical protein
MYLGLNKATAARQKGKPSTCRPEIYHVVSIEPENDGYRYKIFGGYAPLCGWRKGSREDVERYARRLAANVNRRIYDVFNSKVEE